MEDALIVAAVILVLGATWYVPRKISARRRLGLGAALFVIGWAGILMVLHFGNEPFLQSETAVYALMVPLMAALVVSSVFLVTAFFDWLGLTRPRRQRRQFPPYKP